MGLGDGLLAAGQARLIHEVTGEQVTIGAKEEGLVEWMDLYDYIPYISRNAPKFWLSDWQGCRGYIRSTTTYTSGKLIQVHFNMNYRAVPAQIEIDATPNDFIIVEPLAKAGAPPAKQWHHWQELVDRFPGVKFVQLNQDTLKGVERIDTTVVEAAKLMKGCKGYVGTEGFLHHLAAAFDTPAVVVMGAFVPPTVLGYKSQISIAVDDPAELGHCGVYGAMERIPVQVVEKATQDMINGVKMRHTVCRVLGDYLIEGQDIRYC